MKTGASVAAFERELAAYCGAAFAIAAANGTVTLQAALVALGVRPRDRTPVTPLTMSATTIAVLNVGAVPDFWDVDPDTWLMRDQPTHGVPVSLYGLHQPHVGLIVDDAAQTLRPKGAAAFVSLSFQASKILSLGEGGALLTDDEALAERARSYLSLGYRMAAGQARIDSMALKSPTFERHHTWPAINGRMNDVTAKLGLARLDGVAAALSARRDAATMYRDAIMGCQWLTPQHVPDGWAHSWWTYAIATDTPARCLRLLDAVEARGGERPYPAWRLTYHEPAFRHLRMPDYPVPPVCPIAESLQPRLLQFQTNDLASAERNAKALRLAIDQLTP